MFYKKRYRDLRRKLWLFADGLRVQQRQYESMLDRSPPYELDPKRRVQVETLLKHTNSCLEELNKMLEEKGD